MGLKENIIEVLKENDLTIDQMANKLESNENSIRTIINRDLKPSKLIIETNSFRYKYKIYALNTPENTYRHLSHIVMYRSALFGRIDEGLSKVNVWLSTIKEFKENWEIFLMETNSSSNSIKKEINRRSKELNKLEPYSNFVKILKNQYKFILNYLEEEFRNLNITRRDNKNYYIDLELIFKWDQDLTKIVNKFIKWEKETNGFFKKLRSK